jgi:ankyrin repeat protein
MKPYRQNYRHRKRMFKKLFDSNGDHLAGAQFDAYRDGALTEVETAVYRKHLETCETCRTRFEKQVHIGRLLTREISPEAILSPAAAARIEQNISIRMRRALIMNNVRNVSSAVAAVAVLALIIILFVWQSRTVGLFGISKPVAPELAAVEEVVPEIETADEADAEVQEDLVAAEAITEEEPVEVALEVVSDEQLFEAVDARDAAAVKQLLEAGADPNAIKPSGYPVLKAAFLDGLKSNDMDIVTLLVENGADVNLVDGGGNAVLPLAASERKIEIVQLLLDAGADANGTSTIMVEDMEAVLKDAPAIMHAAIGNDLEVVERLIAHDADLDQAETLGNQTTLHVAAFLDRPKVIEMILANGANPDPPGSMTPLMIAADYQNLMSAEAMLAGGADPNAQTKQKRKSALMYGLSRGQDPSFTSIGITEVLLEGGADPNLQDDGGRTALHYAANQNKRAVIPLLIDFGAAIDMQDDSGNTALHLAAQRGRTELVGVLIEQGAALDLRNEEGQTAFDVAKNDEIRELLREAGAGMAAIDDQLIAAVEGGDAARVETLLNEGASPDSSGTGGKVALPVAAGAGQLEIAQLLLEAGADVDETMKMEVSTDLIQTEAPPLIHAAEARDIDMVELLIAHGADVNLPKEGSNETALHVAAWRASPEIITLLLENGADPDLPNTSGARPQSFPLHYAVGSGSLTVLEALLDGGANANVLNGQGHTPIVSIYTLRYSSVSPQRFSNEKTTSIVTALLEGGADPNVADPNGDTVLHFIVGSDQNDLIPLIVAYGAAVDQQNSDGNTALHLAARTDRVEAVSVLVEQGANVNIANNEGQTILDVTENDEIRDLLIAAGAGE